MATVAEISVGLSHEFAITACKAGWEPNDFASLAHSEDRMRELLTYVRGNGKITIIDHMIDGDADPFLPTGLKVEKHGKQGNLKLTPEGNDLFLDGKKIKFHLSRNQQGDKSIKGEKLREELAELPVLNANVLDYLLAHPDLIPDSWKNKAVFFWGTIYRNSDGRLYVRYLYWDDGRWVWNNGWLGRDWNVSFPAAVLAS